MTRDLPNLANKHALTQVSPLQIYLRELSKYPLMSPEEEYESARKFYEDGDLEAARRLVTANLRLVVKIANDFRQAQLNILDLIQEGNYGLMQAVKKFNPYKGVKLSSYAVWWIRAYILKFIMDNKSLVKIGTTAAQRRLFYNLRKEADKLIAEYEHFDTKLLAERLDVREKDVIEMQLRLGSSDLSLDSPIENSNGNGEEGPARGSMLADNTVSAEESLLSGQIDSIFREHLEEFKDSLKGRDLEIFENRLLSENPLTLQAIGDKYGITRERARQLEAKLIERLRAFVREKGVIDIE